MSGIAALIIRLFISLGLTILLAKDSPETSVFAFVVSQTVA